MNDRLIEDASKQGLQSFFSGWHPLESDWLNDLTPELQDMARHAQEYLKQAQRTEKELVGALVQMETWRKTMPHLLAQNAPEIIFDEQLGSRFEPRAFIPFLLAGEASLPLPASKCVALALLQEIHGCAELDAVARKGTLSITAQYLTLKAAWLHMALLLLRLMKESSMRDMAHTIMTLLLRTVDGQGIS